jgi:competence protein ComEC
LKKDNKISSISKTSSFEYRYGSADFLDDLKRAPMIIIVVPLIFGIIAQTRFEIFNINVLPLFAGLMLVLLLLQVFKVFNRYLWSVVYGCFCVSLMFLFGVYLVQIQPVQSSVPDGEQNLYKLRVKSNPQINENSVCANVEILAFSADSQRWRRCSEQAIVYLGKDAAIKLDAGDVLLCATSFNTISPPQNPQEFDYKNYLERRQIYNTAFINHKEIVKIDSVKITPYQKFILMLQQSACRILQNSKLGNEELSVALALLTGNKELIDDDLRQSYIASGTVHLLAISGLHVGIIYMVLNFLLQFMNRSRRLAVIRGMIILIILWIYASVAGMASSIVRASIMFSIFVVSEILNRPKNTYNNIAFSCFIICLFNPYAIFDVGFQLSYLAVLGIVYFQPKFIKLIPCRNVFVKAIVECLSVTVAAQLATLPVILYLFKTFPAYFMCANLILVPFVSIVMYIGLMVLALSWNVWLLALSSTILDLCIKFMNLTVKFFHSLPFSTLDGININGIQCFLLVAAILMLAFLFAFRRRMFLNLMLIFLIGLFGIVALNSYNNNQHSEFGVFGLKNSFMAYFIENGQGIQLRNPSALNTPFHFNTRDYLISRGFTSENNLKRFSTADSVPAFYNGVVQFAGQRIALLPQLEIRDGFSGTPFEVDCLIVTETSNISPEATLACYRPSEIILAGDVPIFRTQEWTLCAQKHGITCINTRKHGFWNKIINR